LIVDEKKTNPEKSNLRNIFKEGQLKSIYDDNEISKKALQYCISRSIPKLEYSKWYVTIYSDEFYETYLLTGSKMKFS
jgi:hypothetical protein